MEAQGTSINAEGRGYEPEREWSVVLHPQCDAGMRTLLAECLTAYEILVTFEHLTAQQIRLVHVKRQLTCGARIRMENSEGRIVNRMDRDSSGGSRFPTSLRTQASEE
jgi:hypothetical protein